MSNKIDITNIKQQILKQLGSSGWNTLFRMYINSYEFDQIIAKLADRVEIGKRFTPPVKDMFKAFEICPLEKLKVVILGDGLNSDFGRAMGIAYSSYNTNLSCPTQNLILNEVKKLYPDSTTKDVSEWGSQGVLLLNTCLTTDLWGQPEQHKEIWEDFIKYILDVISCNYPNTVFCLLGDYAHGFSHNLNSCGFIETGSPREKYYTSVHRGVWDSKNMFVTCNSYIARKIGESEIIKW